MKFWVDDIRSSPAGFKWIQSVDEFIWWYEHRSTETGLDSIEVIDLDHDAGDWSCYGGDYIKIIDYLEYRGAFTEPIIFRIHTMNPVGRNNIQRSISKYPLWKIES